jgi:hypothetical protein
MPLFAKPVFTTIWFWSGTVLALLATAYGILIGGPPSDSAFPFKWFYLAVAIVWVWQEWIFSVRTYQAIYSEISLLRDSNPDIWREFVSAGDITTELSSELRGLSLTKPGPSQATRAGEANRYSLQLFRDQAKRLRRSAYVPSGIFVLVAMSTARRFG